MEFCACWMCNQIQKHRRQSAPLCDAANSIVGDVRFGSSKAFLCAGRLRGQRRATFFAAKTTRQSERSRKPLLAAPLVERSVGVRFLSQIFGRKVSASAPLHSVEFCFAKLRLRSASRLTISFLFAVPSHANTLQPPSCGALALLLVCFCNLFLVFLSVCFTNGN